MSTLGNISAPALSRLFAREDHRQYQYIAGTSDGYIHNWQNPNKLIQHGGGRHAEIMVDQSWLAPMRNGPATPDVDWVPVNELTVHAFRQYLAPPPPTPPIRGTTDYSSPGLVTVSHAFSNPIAGSDNDARVILTPASLGSGTFTDCWVMRKGTWSIDVSIYLSTYSTGSGPWTLKVLAKAYRDYDLYANFRWQVIGSTTFSGERTTHTPWTVGSPLTVTLRHAPLWDVGLYVSPEPYVPQPAPPIDETLYDCTLHAVKI
jgi:hypothetical protein